MMNQQCTLYSGSTTELLRPNLRRESGVWRCTVREEEGRRRKEEEGWVGEMAAIQHRQDGEEEEDDGTGVCQATKAPLFPPPLPPTRVVLLATTNHSLPCEGEMQPSSHGKGKGKAKGRTGEDDANRPRRERKKEREREKRAKGGVRRVMEERRVFQRRERRRRASRRDVRGQPTLGVAEK